MKNYVVIGTGGMGRETMAMAAAQLTKRESSDVRLFFAVEDGYPTNPISGIEVLTLAELFTSFPEFFFTVAIANAEVRERITNLCESRKGKGIDIVSPSAIVYAGSKYGAGSILAPFSIISVNSIAGKSLHLNYYACITHDCKIGSYVTFGPKAQCNGNVTIGDGAYIGAGALIIQGASGKPLTIGAQATIGMGAVVLADVPPKATVVGNPARVIKYRD